MLIDTLAGVVVMTFPRRGCLIVKLVIFFALCKKYINFTIRTKQYNASSHRETICCQVHYK